MNEFTVEHLRPRSLITSHYANSFWMISMIFSLFEKDDGFLFETAAITITQKDNVVLLKQTIKCETKKISVCNARGNIRLLQWVEMRRAIFDQIHRNWSISFYEG